MVKNHLVKFLVNEDEFNRIRINASAKGHKTISSYLRELALSKDMKLESMIIEIHTEVVKNGKRT